MEGTIYRYFELSSKTGEGFDEFKKCLKFDIDLSLKMELTENNIRLSKINSAFENSYNFTNKLNKYLNY